MKQKNQRDRQNVFRLYKRTLCLGHTSFNRKHACKYINDIC